MGFLLKVKLLPPYNGINPDDGLIVMYKVIAVKITVMTVRIIAVKAITALNTDIIASLSVQFSISNLVILINLIIIEKKITRIDAIFQK